MAFPYPTKGKVSRFLRARQLLTAAAQDPLPHWAARISDSDLALARRWTAVLAAGHVDEQASPAEEDTWPPNWATKAGSLSSALGKLRGQEWMASLVQLEGHYNLANNNSSNNCRGAGDAGGGGAGGHNIMENTMDILDASSRQRAAPETPNHHHNDGHKNKNSNATARPLVLCGLAKAAQNTVPTTRTLSKPTKPAYIPVSVLNPAPSDESEHNAEAEAEARARQRSRDKRTVANIIRQVKQQTLQDNTNANANMGGGLGGRTYDEWAA